MSDRPILRLRFTDDRSSHAIEHAAPRHASGRRRDVRLKNIELAVDDRIARSGAPRIAPA